MLISTEPGTSFMDGSQKWEGFPYKWGDNPDYKTPEMIAAERKQFWEAFLLSIKNSKRKL